VETIKGTIHKIIYQNPDNGFTVARFKLSGSPLTDTVITGYFSPLNAGEPAELKGEWKNHQKYGKQFLVDNFRSITPVETEDIQRYLGSGLIKGIGPVFAKRIVEQFKEKTLEILDKSPSLLRKVEGIGKERLKLIKKSWQEQKAIKDIMIFLQSHNIGTNNAIKIINTYQDNAINVLKNDPYQLIYDIEGIGFKTADKIARDTGTDKNSIRRIMAGLIHIMREITEEGHTYIPVEILLKNASEILDVNIKNVKDGLNKLLKEEKKLVIEKDRAYLPYLYEAEKGIAKKIKNILSKKTDFIPEEKIKDEIFLIEIKNKIQYEEEQKKAILKAVNSKFLILTGGPGTGKTTIIKGIIELFERKNLKVALCAPTGRAAKRLEETTKREAKTIHRLLEFNPKLMKFMRNENRPLKKDVFIVDESSMIDTPLMFSLLRGIPDESRVILIGDADQLPSVGPGNILKDLIDSREIDVVKLEKVFRQSAESTIITNAHKINRGIVPELKTEKNSNFFFIYKNEANETAEVIKELVVKRLPYRYRYSPFTDIQVITPMYKGETGAHHLNKILQNSLNPGKIEIKRGTKLFRNGDKVMQIKNNYNKEVFNGDIGRIIKIDLENQYLVVNFDGKKVPYEFNELDELTLSYAATVHKTQGSEYKAVVMPLTTQHYIMLQRNLLYTAVTRAKELIIIVGTKKALYIAVNNNKVVNRYTYLKELIIDELF